MMTTVMPLVALLAFAAGSPVCSVGDVKQVDCNVCLCQDEGVWSCTDLPCSEGAQRSFVALQNGTAPDNIILNFGSVGEGVTIDDAAQIARDLATVVAETAALGGLQFSSVTIVRLCIGVVCTSMGAAKRTAMALQADNTLRAEFEVVLADPTVEAADFGAQLAQVVQEDMNSAESKVDVVAASVIDVDKPVVISSTIGTVATPAPTPAATPKTASPTTLSPNMDAPYRTAVPTSISADVDAESDDVSVGLIVGLVGGCAALVAIVLGVYLYVSKKKNDVKANEPVTANVLNEPFDTIV